MYTILPQRLVYQPVNEHMVQSIYFKERNTPSYDRSGVSVVDMLKEHGSILEGASDRVFQGFVFPNNEISFVIAWPGYGHKYSWVGYIPTVYENPNNIRQHTTRSMLAAAVARCFLSWMSTLALKPHGHPDPRWRIHGVHGVEFPGISFEQLRITRIFRCGTGVKADGSVDFESGDWQAEVLVAGI